MTALAYQPKQRYGLAMRKSDVKRAPYDARYLINREFNLQLAFKFIPTTAGYKQINSISRFIEHWYGREACEVQWNAVWDRMEAIHPSLRPVRTRQVPNALKLTNNIDRGGHDDDSLALERERIFFWDEEPRPSRITAPVVYASRKVANQDFPKDVHQLDELFETTCNEMYLVSGEPYPEDQLGINPETQEIFDTIALYPEIPEDAYAQEDRMVEPHTEHASIETFVERFTGVRMAKTYHRSWFSWMEPGDRPIDRYLGLRGRQRETKAKLKEQKPQTALDRALAMPARDFYDLVRDHSHSFYIDCVTPFRKAIKGVTLDHTLRILLIASWIDDNAVVKENQWAQCMSILTDAYGPAAALDLTTLAHELVTGSCELPRYELAA